MDGVGVRVGASKETKRVAAAAECNAGAAESDDVSGSGVKVGSDHTRTNNHACMSHQVGLLLSNVWHPQLCALITKVG